MPCLQGLYPCEMRTGGRFQVSCPSCGLLLTLDKNNSGKALGLIDNVLKNKKYG